MDIFRYIVTGRKNPPESNVFLSKMWGILFRVFQVQMAISFKNEPWNSCILLVFYTRTKSYFRVLLTENPDKI